MKLSIIIVSFNTKGVTLDSINSIIKNTSGLKYEIIVIDNASTDGSVSVLKNLKKESKIELLLNKENSGFGAANNKALKVAKGEYVLFLNSDTLVTSNVIKYTVDWMEKDPLVGVASCSLKNKDGSLQETGGYFPDLFKVFTWMFFIDDLPVVGEIIKPFHFSHTNSPFYKKLRGHTQIKEVDWLTGAFMLFRKSILEKVGGFDEDYFMYTEEVDLCYRVRRAGWKVLYLPQWSITHLGGQSSGVELPLLHEYEGVKLFYKKHKPGWQFPLLRLFLKSGAFLRMFVMGLTKGSGVYKTYVKAFKLA
jgi:hypothetical protein